MFFKSNKRDYSSTHTTRTKRGRTRYYQKSSLRRKIKKGLKKQGYPKRIRTHATKSGWA